MNFASVNTLFYRQKHIWPVIFVLLLCSACGYRFSGSGNLPGGIEKVAIEILENRTSETGLENTITNDLIFEFSRRGRKVLKDSKKAEAVLTGVIKSESITTISRQAEQSPLARRVQINISLKLTGSDGEVKWSASDVSEFQDYNVGTGKQAAEMNKRRAIESLSKKLAEKVYSRLTDNF